MKNNLKHLYVNVTLVQLLLTLFIQQFALKNKLVKNKEPFNGKHPCLWSKETAVQILVGRDIFLSCFGATIFHGHLPLYELICTPLYKQVGGQQFFIERKRHKPTHLHPSNVGDTVSSTQPFSTKTWKYSDVVLQIYMPIAALS